MKAPEAIAVKTAMASPATPIPRKAAIVRPRASSATKPTSATNANRARPATCVAVPTLSSRCSTPAVDQAAAAPAMKS